MDQLEIVSLLSKPKLPKPKIKPPVSAATQSPLSLDELLERKYPNQVWLVENLIPANALTVFSAAPASYKTWLLLDIALAVAGGKQLFGVFKTLQSGVLIVDEESGERLLQRQLTKLGATKGLNIRIRSLHNIKLTDEVVGLILLDCATYGLNTVVFDSLSHIHNGNENESTDMTPVMKHLQRLAANGITVLLIHHNRKPGIGSGSGGSEVRGSSAILAAVDSQITLIPKNKDRVIVKQNKLRYGKEHEPFELLVVGDEDFKFEYVGETKSKDDSAELKSAISELLRDNGKLFQKQILELLGESGIKTNEHKLRALIDSMLENGILVQSSGIANMKYYSLPPTPFD